jgi:archaellum biogenesis ATPase FlaH
MSIKNEPSLGSFGKEFQEKLVQLILDDSVFASQIGEVLDASFFELKYLQVFIENIFKYNTTYGCFPNRSTVETILRSELEKQTPVVQKQVRDFFARVLAGTIEDIDDEYVKDKSLDFCKKQKLKEAMLKSVSLMENSSFDEVSKIINGALKLGLDNEHGYDFMKHFEERYKVKARDPVSTGWEVIDNLIQGGHGKGELGVVVASTGSGKSMILVHLGAQAMKQGKNVVYYTLELGDTVIGRRFDSCLTGFPLKNLNMVKEEVLEAVRQVPGKLIIKEYPTKSASTETIRNHLKKLEQRDFKVDMIIVDYGDLLKPVAVQREKRNELEGIYEELRGIAAEMKCPLYTASQTNRSGLNAEVVTMESISEAFNKCFVADFIFSLSRTATHKQNNTGRIFIAKNRNGPDGIILPIFMDTSNISIKVLEQTNETVEDINKNAAADQAKKLKEKYARHRKEQKEMTKGE